MSRSRLLIVGLALVAACGDSAGTDTTVPVETTRTTATTTATESTTSTQSSTTVTTVATSTTETSAPDTNDLAQGSGCKPGSGPLPNGEWYGNVISMSDDSLEFDLACFFLGDAAYQAAAEDGGRAELSYDYHTRNSNRETRVIPLAADLKVIVFEPGYPDTEIEVDYDDWAVLLEGGDGYMPTVWLEVEDGAIVHIRQEWRTTYETS